MQQVFSVRVFFAIMLLLANVLPSCGIYFYVTSEQRCFLLDVPPETYLRATYEAPEVTADKKIYIFVFPPRTNMNPNPAPDIEETAKIKGAFFYTSKVPGEHWVCLRVDPNHAPRDTRMRFSMKLNVGESAEDYADIAKKEHMDDLQLQVMKLRDRVKGIQKRQDYVKEKEAVFRNTSESNNARAMWVSIGQIGILVASGILQAKHLQGYFHKKKLV